MSMQFIIQYQISLEIFGSSFQEYDPIEAPVVSPVSNVVLWRTIARLTHIFAWAQGRWIAPSFSSSRYKEQVIKI